MVAIVFERWRRPRFISIQQAPPVVHRALAGELTEVGAYEALSETYDDVWGPPMLERMVPSLLAHLSCEQVHVLDLACGTGMLSRALAPKAFRVHGVDRSAPMLAVARERCADHAKFSFELADIRSFHEPGPFDLVFCGSNSLNYLVEDGALEACLAHIERCMAPQSFLVFDVINELGMQQLSGRVHPVTDDGPYLCFQYDAQARLETSLAVVGEQVERHQRVPINPEDIASSAQAVGLRVCNRVRYASLGPFHIAVGMGTRWGPALIRSLQTLGMTFDGLAFDHYVLHKGPLEQP